MQDNDEAGSNWAEKITEQQPVNICDWNEYCGMWRVDVGKVKDMNDFLIETRRLREA